MPTRVLILGAAGRDFHNFNVLYRGNPGLRGRRVHRHPDPQHRRSALPAGAGRRRLPGRHSDSSRGGAREPRSGSCDVDLAVFAYSDVTHEHVMHLAARAVAAGAAFALAGAETMIAVLQAGHRRHRHSHRGRQEPDQPQDPSPAHRRRQAGRGRAPPDALRRPRQAAGAALRHLRRPDGGRRHHRGARGVRAVRGHRHHHLRRRRLRGHPRGGRGRGRRHPVGRRQQRPAVLPARPPHLRGRRPSRRPRAVLLAGRGQPAPGRRRAHQQGRHRHPRAARGGGGRRRRDQPRRHGDPGGRTHPGRRSRTS